MGGLRLSILVMALFLTCCGGPEDTGLPKLSDDNGGGGTTTPPRVPMQPTNGGSLQPPYVPPNAVATTTAGYVSVEKIVSFTVGGAPDLLGVGESSAGIYFLMERTLSSGNKVWDVHRVTGNAYPVRVCSVGKPGNTYDRVSGLVYDGTSFRMYAETSDYPAWQRIYTFNVTTCVMSSFRSVSSSWSYSTSGVFALFGNKAFFEFNSKIRMFDLVSGVNQDWSYSTNSVSGARPSPLNSTFSIGPDGAVWFADSNRRLWKGTQAGEWLGYAQFPSYPYSEFAQAKFTLPRAGGLRVVSYNKYNTLPLMIYQLDTSWF
jgi:hypothetical protein